MGLTDPQNTLAYQLSRPLCIMRDMSWVDTRKTSAHLVKKINGTFSSNQTSPEAEAVKFYLMDHVLAEVRKRVGEHEPLGELQELCEIYHSELSEQAFRMFTYLILICTRESRHLKNPGTIHPQLKSKFHPATATFNGHVRGKSSSGAVSCFYNAPPNCPLGAYTASLSWIFHKGSFSGGYGGLKWGQIADVMHSFVVGKASGAMLLDTAFTLAHNNGPIFNKGICFTGYDHTIYKVLDVQASSQIPQFVDQRCVPALIHEDVRKAHVLATKLLGACMTGPVDWVKVQELGKKKYPKEIAAQGGTVQPSPGSMKSDYYEISPTEQVEKIARKK